MDDDDFEKLRRAQIRMIASAFALPLSVFSQKSSVSTLIANTVNLHAQNEKIIIDLCCILDMSPEEVIEICQKLPYDLASIRAYCMMHGKFPEKEARDNE